jgi:flagellin
MAVINTNVKAIYSQNALGSIDRASTIAMQQLSTGKRINSARDDAAGAAISTRMTSQIRGLNQAVRNAGDAINLIQTAEGATNQITDMLQRMRELAIQAANDTNSDSQRSYLDLEFQQLKKQIVQISNNTEWNGFSILNGSAGDRVGIKPVYKTVSEINYQSSPPFAFGTYQNGLTSNNSGVGSMTTTTTGPKFNIAGTLTIKATSSGGATPTRTITAAAFTKPDGTVIDLLNDASGNAFAAPIVSVTGSGEISIETANVAAVYPNSNLFTPAVTPNTTFKINQMTASGSPVDFTVGGDTINLASNFQTLNPLTANDLTINGVNVGASFADTDKRSLPTNSAGSAIAKAAAINLISAQTGVSATVNPNLMSGSPMSVGSTAVTGTVTINGYTSPTITTVPNNPRESRAAVVKAINFISQYTGVRAVDTNSDTQGVSLFADDGRNIQINFNTPEKPAISNDTFAQNTGLKQGIQAGTYSLESAVDMPVNVGTTSRGDITNAGLQIANYTSQVNSSLSTAPRTTVGFYQASTPNASALPVLAGSTVLKLAANTYSQVVAGDLVSGPAFPAGETIKSIDMTTGQVVLGLPILSDLTATSPINLTHSTDIKSLSANDLMINGIPIRASMAVDDIYTNTKSVNSSAQASGIAIAAAINASSLQTGVTAVANPVVINGTTLDTTKVLPADPARTPNLYINGTGIYVDLSSTNSTDRLNAVMNAINPQLGATGVYASTNVSGGITLTAQDGRNVSVWFDNKISGGAPTVTSAMFGLGLGPVANNASPPGITAAPNADSTFTSASTIYGGVTLKSEKAISITPGSNGYSSNSNFTALGFQEGTYGGLVNAADAKMSPPRTGRLAFQVGANALQTVTIDLSDFGSNGPITNQITWDVNMDPLAPGTIVSPPNGPQTLVGVSLGPGIPKTNPFGNFSIVLGGVTKTINLTNTSKTVSDLAADIQAQINSQNGNSDLTVTAVNGNLQFVSTSGLSIANPVLNPIANAPDGVYGGRLGQLDPNGNPIINGQPMTRSFIGSKDGATNVLSKLDFTLDAVNAARATMGAVMNRLDHVVNNLTNASMNMTTSQSAITDADYAAASTQLSKTSIMQQAATAVLAQANTSQQSVLKLLQG